MTNICIIIIKVILFIFNLLLWIIAAAILAAVGYYFATLSTYDTIVNDQDNIVYRAVPLAILVLVALLLLLVSLVGFLGSCFNVKILLIIYNIMMIIIIFLQVAGGALVVIFSNQAIPQITQTLTNTIADYNNTNDNIKAAINTIQNALQCCGANGAQDYPANEIPPSCCLDANMCSTTYSDQTKDFFREGCIPLIENAINTSSTIAIVIAILLALLQASGVVLSYILVCCDRKEDDPKVASLRAQLPKY